MYKVLPSYCSNVLIIIKLKHTSTSITTCGVPAGSIIVYSIIKNIHILNYMKYKLSIKTEGDYRTNT